MKQRVNNFLIYILEKPAGADVARTEDTNQEIQKIGYSILAVNLDERKIGYVSNGKREVSETQNFIKENSTKNNTKDYFHKPNQAADTGINKLEAVNY